MAMSSYCSRADVNSSAEFYNHGSNKPPGFAYDANRVLQKIDYTAKAKLRCPGANKQCGGYEEYFLTINRGSEGRKNVPEDFNAGL